jgi:hypothetical protein
VGGSREKISTRRGHSSSVLEPEPLGAKTFGGVVIMFQLWLQSDAGIPCYKLNLASTRAFI